MRARRGDDRDRIEIARMLPEATLQVLGCLRTQRFEPERGNARAGKASGTDDMWATMTDTGPLPCGGREGERAPPAGAGTHRVRASGVAVSVSGLCREPSVGVVSVRKKLTYTVHTQDTARVCVKRRFTPRIAASPPTKSVCGVS